MNGFGAPAAGGFGAPAAGGFGKAPGGFGAPAPAAGGFGAPAPAAGGFGKAPGGFGAPAPAAGGFGAPAPAAGGFGAPAAGGFGKAPAAGGFGAPAPAAGGFGAPAAGGFGKAPGTGGFGAPAPAAGGFGAPAAGGFGAPAGGFGGPAVASAPQQQVSAQELKDLEARLGDLGPGYTPRGQPAWSANIDLSALRDEMVFEELPPAVQQHVAQIHAFIRSEKKQYDTLRTLTKLLEATQEKDKEKAKSSLRIFEKDLNELISGSASAEMAISEAREGDARVQSLSTHISDLQHQVSLSERTVWDSIRLKGEDHWLYSRNAQEGYSQIMAKALLGVGRQMELADSLLRELEAAVGPAARAAGAAPTPSRPLEAMLASPDSAFYLGVPTQRIAVSGGVGDLLMSESHFTANIGMPSISTSSVASTLGMPMGSSVDSAAAVVVSMDNELTSLTQLAARVSSTCDLTQQMREAFARRHTVAVAKSLFTNSASSPSLGGVGGYGTRRMLVSDALKGRQGSYHYDFAQQRSLYNHSTAGPAFIPSGSSGGPSGHGGSLDDADGLLGAMASSTNAPFMHYDASIAARAAQQKATISTTAAPPPTAGGATAPAAAGFGKAPAAGDTTAAAPAPAAGFGKAPAVAGDATTTAPAPAAAGFGKAPATAGDATAAAPAPIAGFGKAPAVAGDAAPAPAAAGFGKAPAPAAAPGFGAAPAPAAGGAPAPATGFGGPAPAPAPAPVAGFGKAPATAGDAAPAPAAAGFGKAPAPAAATKGFAGFGAPAPVAGGFGAPAAGGFGKAPAPPVGFGALPSAEAAPLVESRNTKKARDEER